jgi:hypothetical protein
MRSVDLGTIPTLLLVIISLYLLIRLLALIFRSKYGIVMMMLAVACIVVVGLAGSFVGNLPADKNGDGAPDTQIIGVVQPEGENPETDMGFAQVNRTNAEANTINARAFNWVVTPALVFILAMVAMGVFLYLKR